MPRVYSYVLSRCGHDVELAEELTQRTFVAAVEQRWRFDGRSDITTWLCGIARHKLADHYRRAERDQRRQIQLEVREIDRARGRHGKPRGRSRSHRRGLPVTPAGPASGARLRRSRRAERPRSSAPHRQEPPRHPVAPAPRARPLSPRPFAGRPNDERHARGRPSSSRDRGDSGSGLRLAIGRGDHSWTSGTPDGEMPLPGAVAATGRLRQRSDRSGRRGTGGPPDPDFSSCSCWRSCTRTLIAVGALLRPPSISGVNGLAVAVVEATSPRST